MFKKVDKRLILATFVMLAFGFILAPQGTSLPFGGNLPPVDGNARINPAIFSYGQGGGKVSIIPDRSGSNQRRPPLQAGPEGDQADQVAVVNPSLGAAFVP